MIPLPMVSVLFERGATGPDDSAAIAVAVAIYGVGLPAFVVQKLLQPLYFAREDTQTPFRFAVWTMLINAALAIGLAPVLGWIAPAIATSVAGWAMVAMLAWGNRGMGDVARFDARLRNRLWRICLASAFMGGVLWMLNALLGAWLVTDYVRYAALALLLTLGILSYAIAGQITGAFTLREIRGAFRRGPPMR